MPFTWFEAVSQLEIKPVLQIRFPIQFRLQDSSTSKDNRNGGKLSFGVFHKSTIPYFPLIAIRKTDIEAAS